MSFLEALRSALAAIAANKLRSALTMLGIIIGVGAVIVMVAIGSGARQRVVDQIKTLGANLAVIQAGNVTQGGVRLGAGASSTLTDEDAYAVRREVEDVTAAAPTLRSTSQLVAGGSNWQTIVMGVDDDFLVAREWEIEEGRGFDPEEVRRAENVVVLGKSVARNLFGEVDPVGSELRIRTTPFRVVGVLAAKGQTMSGFDQDDIVLVPLETSRRRVLGRNWAKGRSVGQIMVKFEDGADLDAGIERITALLRQRHRLQDDQENDFTVRNLTEIMNTVGASAQILSLLLAAVAAVSLVVGGIGIMNIMLVSVTERTREIGLRMAVGARPAAILSQFLIEATTLSLIGGLFGTAIGVALAHVISATAGWPTLVAPEAIVIAVGFSALVGIFFGFYPAKRASRLDPIEALRRV